MAKEPDSVLSTTSKADEEIFDRALRPKSLSEFIGQQKLKDNLQVFITAARQRKERAAQASGRVASDACNDAHRQREIGAGVARRLQH